MTPFFEDTRETPRRLVILAFFLYVATTTILNFVFGQHAVREILGVVKRVTGGLVQEPIVAGLFVFVPMAVVIFRIGGLRYSDVGWRARDIGPAALVTLVFWVAMQASLALWLVCSGEPLQWNDRWNDPGVGWICGALLAQLLSNALLEEMFFRGYFLPQIYLTGSVRFRPLAALLMALLVSQMFFALSHIPNRMFLNVQPVEDWFGDQVNLFVGGLIYAAVYLITRNIFVCVGLHSLYNETARLMAVPFEPDVKIVWHLLVLIFLVVWLIARRFGTGRRAPFTEHNAAQTPA